MVDSSFVFENGKAIQVGSPGDTDIAFADGSSVVNSGESTFAFENGVGLGGVFDVFYDISDWEDSDPVVDRVPKGIFYSGGVDRSLLKFPTNLDDERYLIKNSGRTGDSGNTYDYYADWEDESPFALPRDCELHWGESNLSSKGYITIGVYHIGSGRRHEVWLGEDETDGYQMTVHDDSEGDTTDTWYFEGRMYEDGDVTDTAGNVLGTWNA